MLSPPCILPRLLPAWGYLTVPLVRHPPLRRRHPRAQVQPEFATFFLGFIRGDYNFLHLFHDLHGLDPELYKNLMFLKTYSGGDVEDLCLTFTVTENAFGANKEVRRTGGRGGRGGGRL